VPWFETALTVSNTTEELPLKVAFGNIKTRQNSKMEESNVTLKFSDEVNITNLHTCIGKWVYKTGCTSQASQCVNSHLGCKSATQEKGTNILKQWYLYTI
jgi:hypothetical protein